MIRTTNISKGDIINLSNSNEFELIVDNILNEWNEEGEDNGLEVSLRLISKYNNNILGNILSKIGEIPIPPYLKRQSIKKDNYTYQTIYSNNNQMGSAAAPTAGLHFTNNLLETLEDNGI